MSHPSRPYPRHDRNTRKMTQPFAMHDHNPAGSKLLRRFYKIKTGIRGTAEEAKQYYRERIK